MRLGGWAGQAAWHCLAHAALIISPPNIGCLAPPRCNTQLYAGDSQLTMKLLAAALAAGLLTAACWPPWTSHDCPTNSCMLAGCPASPAAADSYVDDNKRVKWCPSVPHCGHAVRTNKEPFCEVGAALGPGQ